MRPIVLLDCDGVLADFVSHFLLFANAGSRRVDREWIDAEHGDVTSWDIGEAFPLLKHAELYRVLTHAGFVRKMPVMPGAVFAVRYLQKISEVYCVTTPLLGARYWGWERTQWLSTTVGITQERVILCDAKELVDGDVLVDDRPEHLEAWAKRHPVGMALLWSSPRNASFKCPANIHRVTTWRQVIETVRAVS